MSTKQSIWEEVIKSHLLFLNTLEWLKEQLGLSSYSQRTCWTSVRLYDSVGVDVQHGIKSAGSML